jgi:ATP-dependent Zn protease
MAKKKPATPPSVGRNLITYGLIFLALVGLLQLVGAGSNGNAKAVDMSAVAAEVKAGTVTSIEIDGNQLTVATKDNATLTSQREPGQPLSQLLRDYGVTPEQLATVAIRVHQPSGFQTFMEAALPFLLPLMRSVAACALLPSDCKGLRTLRRRR